MLDGKSRWANGLILLAVIAAVSMTANAQQEGDPSAPFQGKWTVISLNYRDFEIKGSANRPMLVTFDKNEMISQPAFSASYFWAFQFSNKGRESGSATRLVLDSRGLHSKIKINPNKIAGEIDLEEVSLEPIQEVNNLSNFNSTKKPEKKSQPTKRRGIYRFNNDTLELCINSNNGVRPTTFTIPADGILLRLIRETK